ncbi:MAG: cupin domain-containing protein [Oscillospiraceae bacterium]|nr:cupin domain-containing protein [Oscillospiraceae bacterium]
MLKLKEELSCTTELNQNGEIKLYLSDLAEFDIKNDKLRTFALANLKAGEEVEFHIHKGECEYYYILSGTGVYTDNQNKIEITPGTVTFTPSGSGHGIKNTGSEMLEFIALIVKD